MKFQPPGTRRFERPEISVDRYNRYNRYDCVTVPCGARRFAGLRDTPSPDRPSDRRHRHTAALTAALATTTMITATLATTSLVMTTVTYMLHRLHNRYTSEILAA